MIEIINEHSEKNPPVGGVGLSISDQNGGHPVLVTIGPIESPKTVQVLHRNNLVVLPKGEELPMNFTEVPGDGTTGLGSLDQRGINFHIK